jgi:hypothetical protein
MGKLEKQKELKRNAVIVTQVHEDRTVEDNEAELQE